MQESVTNPTSLSMPEDYNALISANLDAQLVHVTAADYNVMGWM
jgi:hypothetical protein